MYMKLIEHKHHCSLIEKTELIEVFQLDSGTLEVKVDGKIVTGYHMTEALGLLFSDTVDMDNWKHSWHMDCKLYNQKKIRESLEKIIDEKIKERQEDIDYLLSVKKILDSQESFN
jgi:hypothetical protein